MGFTGTFKYENKINISTRKILGGSEHVCCMPKNLEKNSLYQNEIYFRKFR